MIHLITGEYPPTPGGVADYAELVAGALAERGERVHVWAPGRSETREEAGVSVHRIAGRFAPDDLARLDRALSQELSPRRLIVQWTPHSFGFHSLNVGFAAWLWKRAHVNRDRVELMIHEPFVAFGEGSRKQDAAACVHRLMAMILLQSAAKVWISIPAWEQRLAPFCSGRKVDFEWLPVPSNIEKTSDSRRLSNLRPGGLREGQWLVGHFGTFRQDVAGLLAPALEMVLAQNNVRVLLMGRGSDEFYSRFINQYPLAEDRVITTGELSASDAARHLSACNVMLQPYPDGISSRRGTAMAALSLGIPVVTNLGHLSEPLWASSQAVELAASSAAADLAASVHNLLTHAARRTGLAVNARWLYVTRFDLKTCVARLQGELAPAGMKAVKAAA